MGGQEMNKYDILPTKSNLALSIKNDTTGRNSNLYNLLRLLNFQQDSLSIAINGSWGTGKTFFIKQCQLMLDNAFAQESENNKEVIQARNTLFSPENLTDIQKSILELPIMMHGNMIVRKTLLLLLFAA